MTVPFLILKVETGWRKQKAPFIRDDKKGASFDSCGPKGTRTLDLFNAIEALFQLSYRPANGWKLICRILIQRPSCVNMKDKPNL